MRSILFITLLLGSLSLKAQDPHALDVSENADCDCAKEVNTLVQVGATTPPLSHGKKLEFLGNDRRSLYFMEREHHTVWYKFTIVKTGVLTFSLKPTNPKDDYDFVLYKYNGSENFCNDIVKKKIFPIRTNLARNSVTHSETGLDYNGLDPFVRAGKGNTFSKSLQVRKGEVYYLLVDNVYPKGEGHTIKFAYERGNYELAGRVIDDISKQPLKAEIVLQDMLTGEIILKTSSDSLSGKFNLNVPYSVVQKKENYTVQIFKDKYFFRDTIVSSGDVPKLIERSVTLDYRLKKIKKGGVYHLPNIHFYPGLPVPTADAPHHLKLLEKMMAMNQKMVIEISGHTNLNQGSREFHLKLSKSRAEMVKHHLVKSGVADKRIEAVGYGFDKMIFSREEVLKDAKKGMLNQRVEVKVLEY